MKKSVLITGGVLIAFGLLTWKLTHLARTKCSVCIQFNSLSRCGDAYGTTEEEAILEAHRSLCAQIAGGVTETLACQAVARENIQCKAER